MDATKRCCTCRKWCPLNDFHRCCSESDGLHRRCKVCSREARAKGITEHNATRRAWAARNRDKLRAEGRRRYAANRELACTRNAAWRAANPQKCKAARQAWKTCHPERVTELNRDRRRRLLAAEGSFTGKAWFECCVAFDHRCAYCGRAAPLTQHHVVPLACGGSNWISNIVPACRSCNSRIGTKTIQPRCFMHEKRGVIDEENTRPEKPGEKDLEQHLTKRAADTVASPRQPAPGPDEFRPYEYKPYPLPEVGAVTKPIEELSAKDREEVLRNGWAESPIGGSVGNTAGLNRIKLDR